MYENIILNLLGNIIVVDNIDTLNKFAEIINNEPPEYVTMLNHELAKGLSFHSQNLDADEFLDVVKIPFDEALRMVLDNEIKDGKTQIAIMKAGLMQK